VVVAGSGRRASTRGLNLTGTRIIYYWYVSVCRMFFSMEYNCLLMDFIAVNMF